MLHTKKYAKLYFSIHDVSSIQAIRFGSWDWFNIDCYRYLIRSRQISSNTFLDIGSNIGYYSCNLSGYFSSILAFEPNPIAFNVLEANIMMVEQKSSTSHNCFNFALGSNVAPVNLKLSPYDNSSVSTFHRPLTTYDSYSSYNVQMLNASNMIFDNVADINAISAIRINVDGSGISVLNGLLSFFKAVDTLPLLTIKMLDVVSNQQISNLLVGYGYRYFYSDKINKIKTHLGLSPFMYKLSPDELSVGRFYLVYCSSYPLNFE